jgi:hypothetical protein
MGRASGDYEEFDSPLLGALALAALLAAMIATSLAHHAVPPVQPQRHAVVQLARAGSP